MLKYIKTGAGRAALCGAVLGAMVSTSAMAEADKVSADMSYSFNSHFMSYGADVWGAGSDFYGSESTSFFSGSVTFAPTDALSFNTGVWMDVNNNTVSGIGGKLQEVDWWVGGSYTFGIVSAGVTYQHWIYAGDVEKILDISVDLDDSGLWGESGFSLAPSVIWHIRLHGNGAQDEGSAIQLSIGPGFTLSEDIDLSVSIPAGMAFFLDDNFQGGTEGGLAYGFVGLSFDLPFDFIKGGYGDWALNFSVIGYFTDDDSIPGNPKENFLTSSVGISVAF